MLDLINPDTPGRIEGDLAGHLVGDRFGGSPKLDNLVSQSQNVNLSQYKKIENQWAKAIREGKEVTVNVDIKYDGNGGNTMRKVFEDYFSELQADMVAICLEYVEKKS